MATFTDSAITTMWGGDALFILFCLALSEES